MIISNVDQNQKSTMLSKDGSIKVKTSAEEAIAREKKEKAKEQKEALQLAKKILNSQKS